MGDTICHRCGDRNYDTSKRCVNCGCVMAREHFKLGDKVYWSGSKGSHRKMNGTVVAVIPEYMSAVAVLTGSGIRISIRAVAFRERPFRSYVVDIGGLAHRSKARYVIPSPFILRKTGD